MMRNQRRVATCGDRQSSQLVQPPMIMRAVCISGRRRNASNCVKMIRHHHEVEELEFGILRRQAFPIRFNRPPERVQDDLLTDNRSEERLVLRDLNRHGPPPRTIIDVRIPKRLMEIQRRHRLFKFARPRGRAAPAYSSHHLHIAEHVGVRAQTDGLAARCRHILQHDLFR